MTKAIPRIGSRKNGRRIQKGVIHFQASFNNSTIVTIRDVIGRVVSWSSAGTCGFKGTRRGTPFAAQTAAGRNAIRRRKRTPAGQQVPPVSCVSKGNGYPASSKQVNQGAEVRERSLHQRLRQPFHVSG